MKMKYSAARTVNSEHNERKHTARMDAGDTKLAHGAIVRKDA